MNIFLCLTGIHMTYDVLSWLNRNWDKISESKKKKIIADMKELYYELDFEPLSGQHVRSAIKKFIKEKEQR